MALDPQIVIDVALSQVGYCEKETEAMLDDKEANPGDENFTKYARDLAKIKFFNSNKQGKAWCGTFVAWCYNEAYGKDAALKLLCQPTKDNCGAGCEYIASYFMNKDQWYSNPQPCDVVVFFNSAWEYSHAALVYKVDNSYFYTVEGNTSNASGVINNGGEVAAKRYRLNYDRVAGFGRPNFGIDVSDIIRAPEADEQEESTFRLGDRTVKMGDFGADVAELQSVLISLGYDLGSFGRDGVDGNFGAKTDAAVRSFQAANGLEVDGKCGKLTSTSLLKAINELGTEANENTPDKQGTSASPEKTTVLIVCDNGGKVNLREGDSYECSSVVQVIPGTQLDYVVTSPSGWHAVRYKRRILWVSPQYSSISNQ